MKKYRLALIEWIDSTAFDSWRQEEAWTERTPVICRTTGYVVSQDKTSVHLASSKANNGDLDGRLSIPKGCIRKLHWLQEPEPWKQEKARD